MQDDIQRIIRDLTPESRELLRTTANTDLIRFHHDYGRYLRNSFRAGRFPALLAHCHQTITQSGQPMSFDALSTAALLEIWKAIQD